MKRMLTTALLCAAALLALAAPAQGAFGLSDFDVFFAEQGGAAATEAGSHPDSMTTSFGVNHTGEGSDAQPDGELKDATFAQVAGLALDPTAAAVCSNADFSSPDGAPACAAASQVGEVAVTLNTPDNTLPERAEVYNLAPPPGTAARLGFRVVGVPVVIEGGIAPTPPYNLLGVLRNTRQVLKVFAAELTLFGAVGGEPFITLPTSCTGPAATTYEALSWQGQSDSGLALTHDEAGNPRGFIGCEKLPFVPEVTAQPTTRSASSASGLRFELAFDQAGLTDSAGQAQSALKDAVVTLPEGMTVNPSIAAGLGVCSEADLARETLAAAPGEGCPEGSKVGTVEVATPLLSQTLPGAVYVAEPDNPDTAAPENPFDSLIALYIVIRHPGLGVLVKLPAKVEPHPLTGQLMTTVRDAPQLPFSRFSFRFREGQRAPLITPPGCGAYQTTALLTPWARPAESVPVAASFEISSGVGGGPCPAGGAPFEPGFEAGSLNNAAGAFSPFAMRLTRRDGDQGLKRFDATLPDGVLARIAGVDKCPEAQIALAKSKTGKAELRSPSCPLNSRIGRTQAGAGVGSQLIYVPGDLYLAGPFGGAPLSVVAITPAVAGPFDVGTVVVRQALAIDPRSGEVSADGSKSDPIPDVLAGIPLRVRDIQVFVDRSGFTLNPTSCEEMATVARISGDAPVTRSARFQAAGCAALPFRPRLGLRLFGGTARGAHPALRTVFRPRPGDANSSRVVARFPRSAFVEQAHIRTVCTRVQFAADACPKGSIYGRVAAFTPLLEEPLRGPVYLRSSNNTLPDLVFDLKGEVDFEAVARVDSVKGALRAIAYGIPDAPIDKVVIQMQGGKKGLIVNSRNLCTGRNRAGLRFFGHNGKRANLRTPVRAVGCEKRRKARRSSHRRP